MTTKAEEIKALAKIRKIVEDLGENSYIGTAMIGVLDDAEQNIEYDFGLSMYDRWQSAEQEYEHARAKLAETEEALVKMSDAYKKLNDDFKRMFEQYGDLNDQLQKERKEVWITLDGATQPIKKEFSEVRYIDHGGFRFINVVEESGWTTSYKLSDLKGLEIR